jgi:hypothetical protein
LSRDPSDWFQRLVRLLSTRLFLQQLLSQDTVLTP